MLDEHLRSICLVKHLIELTPGMTAEYSAFYHARDNVRAVFRSKIAKMMEQGVIAPRQPNEQY